MKVLVVGGSGYLGQFLVNWFADRGWSVGFTHHSTSAPTFNSGDIKAFWADLATGNGINEAVQAMQPIDAVVNCAAVSQPAQCERDPAYAESINIPTTLLDALDKNKEETGNEPILVHISTDQVYDGSRSNWNENDACQPVNNYGRTKLQAEQLIQLRWPNHYILRSSIIFGPLPPGAPVGRALFLQFIDNALAANKPTTFFNDEWRCPVYVEDIFKACFALVTAPKDGEQAQQRVYNMGGPQRMSRYDMAMAVAKVRGYNPELILSDSAASIDRGVKSPADISMDSTRLWKAVEIEPMQFEEALRAVYSL